MSDSMLLAIAAGVFLLLLVGIALTIYEFHKAGAEPVADTRDRSDIRGR
ncbi:hypothetical protein [Microbulbifer sp. TYP-18]